MAHADWQQRVKQEFTDLETKVAALRLFINSEEFKTIVAKEKALLMLQYEHMVRYLSVLKQRIEGWL